VQVRAIIGRVTCWWRDVSTQSPGPDVSSRRGRFCNTRRIFGALPVRAESQRHQILTKLGVGGEPRAKDKPFATSHANGVSTTQYDGSEGVL